MGKAPSHKKTRYKTEKTDVKVSCKKQFPDCPEQPNDSFCKSCPLYKN